MTISKVLRARLAALFCVLSIAGIAFGQTDTPRRTTAITYPLDDLVTVQFRGTTRFPRMKGEARIRRTGRTGTQIDLSVSKMPRPFELGAGYATYVAWAISPDGQVDNLGEIKRRGFFEFDSKLSVTTPLQTFAIIITAEPHFLVRRPSQEIMLENLTPSSSSGRVIATTPAIQYFGNSSDFFRDPRTPEIAELDYSKTPSAVLQAKQAVALARFGGADRDAPDELKEAETLLRNAEDSWKAGRDEETVDIAARKAVSVAVKAENTAIIRKEAREKRNERSRVDAESRQAEDKITEAQNQITDLRAQLASETRNRELTERDSLNYSNQIRDLREENGRLREELGKTKVELENARAGLAAAESEKQAADQQRAREARLANLQSAQPTLIQSLRRFGTVSSSDGAVVLTIPETLWSGVRALTFSSGAEARISGIAELLAANPDYRVSVESHLDDRGTPEEITALTEQRSRAVAEKLVASGIDSGRVEAKGMGSSVPVAANTTAANRARNRRIRIILTPAI